MWTCSAMDSSPPACNVIEVKGKAIPITGLCGPEGGYRYSSTLPRLRH